MRRALLIFALLVTTAGCHSAPEPVDTPEMRAAKVAALAAAAQEAYESRDYAKAVEQARGGVQLDGTHLDSWYWLGAALFASGKDDEALASARRFIDLAGTKSDRHVQLAWAYDWLGWIAFRKNQMDDAGKYFSLALAQVPTLPHALDGRGQVAYLKMDYDTAIRDLTKVLGLGSTSRSVAIEYRGLAYYWKGDFAKALPDLKASADYTGPDRRTNRKDMLRAVAFCYLGLGETDTATKLIKQALEFTDEEKRYNAAAMTYLGGDRELALRRAGIRSGIRLREGKKNAATILLVDRVAPSSPAEKATVRAGDEITMVNGVPVATVNQYREVIKSASLGSRIRLSIIRNGVPKELTLTMGDAEYVFKTDPYLYPLLVRPPKPSKDQR